MVSPLLSPYHLFWGKNRLFFLCLPHNSPHGLLLFLLIQDIGNRLFTVKHQDLAVFLAVNRLHPPLCFPLLAGADACFVSQSCTGSNPCDCSRSLAYSFRVVFNSEEYFCSCSTNRFRLCSMAAMSLGNFAAASSSVYASNARSSFFSERSSSKSSASAAIFAASSWYWNTWTAERVFSQKVGCGALLSYPECPLSADCTV